MCALSNGSLMAYELLVSPQFDASTPMTFIISLSGTGGQHINHFSRRLPHPSWVVAVPLRPENAPLFFEGSGAMGDGLWHLKEFCAHLLKTYVVDFCKFLMVGVSNGGNAVLRFGMRYPELCRGIVVVTAGVDGRNDDVSRLAGIPLDMYVGSKDECGFYQPMRDLEASLRAVHHEPPASLTIFEDAGHTCSPLVDLSLITQKMLLMCLRSHPPGRAIRLRVPEAGVLTVEEIQARVRKFCEDIGLVHEIGADGMVLAKVQAPLPIRRGRPSTLSITPNIFVVRNKEKVSRGPMLPIPRKKWRPESESTTPSTCTPDSTRANSFDLTPPTLGIKSHVVPLQPYATSWVPTPTATPTAPSSEAFGCVRDASPSLGLGASRIDASRRLGHQGSFYRVRSSGYPTSPVGVASDNTPRIKKVVNSDIQPRIGRAITDPLQSSRWQTYQPKGLVKCPDESPNRLSPSFRTVWSDQSDRPDLTFRTGRASSRSDRGSETPTTPYSPRSFGKIVAGNSSVGVPFFAGTPTFSIGKERCRPPLLRANTLGSSTQDYDIAQQVVSDGPQVHRSRSEAYGS